MAFDGPDRPPRTVFQIGSGWFPERKGGAETVFHELYRHLPAEGFATRGLVPGSDAVAATTAGRMRGFPVEGRGLAARARAIRAAQAASFAEARPDLVAVHFALYALPLLDRVRALPLVIHFHGPWALEAAAEGAGPLAVRAKMAAERLVYRRADRLIVLSDAFGRILQERYGVPDRLLRLVPGGADNARFDIGESRAAARARLGWEPDRPALFAVRRLVRRMGLANLVEAMAGLRQRHPGAVLHVAGTGPERAALEAQARALGVADTVRFEGFVPDEALPLAYRAADLTVVPTESLEGFGLIAAESLAAGTPVLVTPVGGLPEVVSGLSPGLVLRGHGAAEIGAGLAAALDDPAALPDAAACRDYARATFGWDLVARRTAAVYREVL